MKKIFNFFWKNALIKSSAIILVGSLISNFGTYLFHLVMGRLLGPADYGVLESLISITYFLGIPIGVLGLVIVRYISREKNNKERVASFIKKTSRKIFIFGLVFHLLFLLSFPVLKNLVKVNSFILFLGLGLGSFLSIYLTLFSSILQGIMQFLKLSLFNIFGAWSKLAVAIVLIFFGFRVGGAVWAITVSTLLTIILGHELIKKQIPLKLSSKVDIQDSLKGIGNYSLAVLVSNLSLVSFFTVDVILARHFLSPIDAGRYASLSVLGKVVFFASSPIVSVMFPMVSEKHANGGNYQKLFISSFLMVLAISVFISTVYFIFPEMMVKILFGKEYLSAAGNLWLFSIFISLYSLCSLLLNFYLSISKTRPIVLSLFFAVFQIILISIYHRSIEQIVLANIVSLSLLLAGLLVYYLKVSVLKTNKG